LHKLLSGPHRRYNPLLDEWVLTSPQRLSRPWQGQIEPSSPDDRPRHDPSCYLCPGNVRANGDRTPSYAATFVFDNDFPALVPGLQGSEVTDGLLRAAPQPGRCRVVCFSPRHDLTVAQMSADDIGPVVRTWCDEVESLGAQDAVRYVQVFENKGAAMGCSNPHPHGQIWASRDVPMIPQRKLDAQQRYVEAHGGDLLGDYLAQELRCGDRLVCRNDLWVALVPFWAVWPFETMLIPVRRAEGLPQLTGEERHGLADIIRRLTARYDNLFRTSFPYSMGFHGRPTDAEPHPGCRLHAVYFPPLLRSATVRKFLVGYEITAEPQRDLSAEQAAATLRGLSERHYSDG
jgi:UDPglucose--hexose-1-phosphate uridylyltransferase